MSLIPIFSPADTKRVEFIDSYFSNSRVGTGPYTWTFSGVDFGDESPERRIVIGVGTRVLDNPSMTIGGGSATKVVERIALNGSDSASCAIFIAGPSGASGTVVLTNDDPSSGGEISIGVWAVYGLNSATATDTDTITSSAGNVDLSLNAPANSVVIAMACWDNTSLTLSGVTNDFVEGTTPENNGGSAFVTTADATFTITAGNNGTKVAAAAVWV